jgi:hypothetical protein
MAAHSAFSQCRLNDSKYGQDIVVALSERAVNSTMVQYLNKMRGSGIVNNIIFIASTERGKDPVPVDYEKFKTDAGVDPFAIPAIPVPPKDKPTDERLLKLRKHHFRFAIRVKPGIPQGVRTSVLSLKDGIKQVHYKLYCSEFLITQIDLGNDPEDPPAYLVWSQDPKSPIHFGVDINLQLSDIKAKDWTEAGVPSNVANRAIDLIKNYGAGAFSIQQLVFDINSARLTNPPIIQGLATDQDAYNWIQTKFLNVYWKHQKDAGEPVLVYNVKFHDNVPVAGRPSLTMTDLDLAVQPYLNDDLTAPKELSSDEQRLAALCYLGTTSGTVKGYQKFDWNWIIPSEASQFHGVIAIRRDTFADWFAAKLNVHIEESCRIPHVSFNTPRGWDNADYSLDKSDGKNGPVGNAI